MTDPTVQAPGPGPRTLAPAGPAAAGWDLPVPAVRVLGPVAVGGGRRPGTLGANAVLSLALARAHTRTVETLIEDVWPDGGPSAGRQALQTLISRLRSGGAGDLIETVPGGYRLRGAHGVVDLDLLERVAATAGPAGGGTAAVGPTGSAAAAGPADPGKVLDDVEAALGLWDEPLGGGASNPVLLEELGSRAERARARLLLSRAEALLAVGHPARAADAAADLARADPADARPVALCMRALAAQGRTAEALECFARHRAHLREGLGADPSPALVDLNTRLLRETEAHGGPTSAAAPVGAEAPAVDAPPPEAPDRAPAAPLRVGVRAVPSPIVGREADLAAVDGLLAVHRLVSVAGVGGLGKTRLAMEVARRRAGAVVVVELAGVQDGSDVEQVASAAVADVQIPRRRPPTLPDPLEPLVRALSVEPTLLVVDNCEHLPGAAARLVAAVLARVADARVLTTTRRPLGLAGEHVYPLASLASLSEDGPGPAVQLFGERARAVRPTALLEPGAVARLCDRLDGLPLAIELAAARVRSMSVEEIERRLSDRFALLTTGDPTAPRRHRTLRAVVDWSWDLLTETQRELCRWLSVFPAWFDADGAATLVEAGRREARASGADTAHPADASGADAVSHPADAVAGPQGLAPPVPGDAAGPEADAAPVDQLAVLDDLDALVGQSMLKVYETPQGVRYRMTVTIREYCAEQAAVAGSTRFGGRALAAWARRMSARLLAMMAGPATDLQPPVVHAEEDNLLAALRAAMAAGDMGTACAVFGALGTWWSVQGSIGSLAELGEDLLAAMTRAGLGRGRPDGGAPTGDALADGGALAGLEPQDVTGVCLAASLIVFLEQFAGTLRDVERARTVLRAALTCGAPIPAVIRFEGELVLALEDKAQLSELTAAAAADPDPTLRTLSRLLISGFEENVGNLEAALDLGTQAHAIAVEANLDWLQAVTSRMLAGLYSEMGRADAALEWIGTARAEAERIGGHIAGQDVAQIEALGALSAGDVPGARAILDRWEPGAHPVPEIELMMQATRAEIELAAGRPEAAAAIYDRVLSEAEGHLTVTEPWWIIATAGRLVTHLAAGSHGPSERELAAELSAVVRRAPVAAAEFADHPVTGTAAVALAVWHGAENPSWPAGPLLLALAERLSSRQDVPSLGRDVNAARMDPDRLARARAAVAGLPAERCLAVVLELLDHPEAVPEHLAWEAGR